MNIDNKDAERLAKDLISEIAPDWGETPTVRVIKENDSYIFEYTLQPGKVVRSARVVERPNAPSVFRFNPLAEATEIVISTAFTMNMALASNPKIAQIAIRNIARSRIIQMLISASDVFTDAMWQARMIGETIPGVRSMKASGRPDIARGLIKSVMAMFEKKLRNYFGEIKQKQNPKINQQSVTTALATFYPMFRNTGQIPSQRQFARTLGVTPKAWRDYLRNNQFGDHDTVVRQWLEQRLPPPDEKPDNISG